MKMFVRTAIATLFFLCFTLPSVAQVELMQSGGNQFVKIPGNPDRPWAEPTIDVSKQIYVQGYYKDFAQKKATIVLVELRTPDGLSVLKYPAALLDPQEDDDRPFAFPIYGPWFYEGEKELLLNIKLVKLNVEEAARIRGKFTQIFDRVSDIVPLIPGAAPVTPFLEVGDTLIKKAWDAYDDIAVRNETEDMGTISITRLTRLSNKNLPATYSSWFILTTREHRPFYEGLASYPSENAVRRPQIVKRDKARVLLLEVQSREPSTSFTALGTRLAKFLNTEQTRLDKANIALDNPFAGPGLAADSHVRRIFSGFLSQLEVQASRNPPSGTTQSAVQWLVGEFYKGQFAGENSSAYVRLDEAREKRVTTAFSSLFAYKNSAGPQTNIGEQGFAKIMPWKTWLDARVAATPSAITWQPAHVAGPYAEVNADYARAKAIALLPPPPPTPAPSATPTPISYPSMREQIDNLQTGLMSILRPSDTNPYMLFEQQEVAEWAKTNLRGLKLTKSPKDVAAFADELDKQLTSAKVLYYNQGQSRWEMPEIVDFAYGRFQQALPAIGALDAKTANKHAKLQEAFSLHIIPARRRMSADERKTLDEKLDPVFKDNVSGQAISAVGYDNFLNDNVFTVSPGGQISAGETEKSLTSALRYWRATYENPRSVPETAQTALLKATALRDFMDLYLRNPGLDLAVYQRVVQHVREFAPRTKEFGVPESEALALTWRNSVAPRILSLTYDAGLKKFGVPAGSKLDEIFAIGIGFADARRLMVEPQDGQANLQNLVTWFYNTSLPEESRAEARKVLEEYVVLPDNQGDAARPYDDFMKRWSPVWSNGKWRAGLLVEIERIQGKLTSARDVGVEPQGGFGLLQNLVTWYSATAADGLPEGIRAKARSVLGDFVELPADLTPSPDGYTNFLKRKVRWDNGKYRQVPDAQPVPTP